MARCGPQTTSYLEQYVNYLAVLCSFYLRNAGIPLSIQQVAANLLSGESEAECKGLYVDAVNVALASRDGLYLQFGTGWTKKHFLEIRAVQIWKGDALLEKWKKGRLDLVQLLAEFQITQGGTYPILASGNTWNQYQSNFCTFRFQKHCDDLALYRTKIAQRKLNKFRDAQPGKSDTDPDVSKLDHKLADAQRKQNEAIPFRHDYFPAHWFALQCKRTLVLDMRGSVSE